MHSKDTVFYSKTTLGLKGKILDLSYPAVMGILNVTPDSFYSGSRYNVLENVVKRAGQMLEEGAAILDMGGYSSRPGAENISEAEEAERVVPAIRAVAEAYPEAVISVDTFRASVARAAVAEGAAIVNDISGGELDPDMFTTVAELGVPYILMHMKGTPQTMTTLAQYEDILQETIGYFHRKVYELRVLGVKDVIIDPGFGFAKKIGQNYKLLKDLNYFKCLNLPVLAGLSRKSMIYKRLNISVEEALNGTTVLNTIALMNGADLLRVHDVRAAIEAVKLYKETYN